MTNVVDHFLFFLPENILNRLFALGPRLVRFAHCCHDLLRCVASVFKASVALIWWNHELQMMAQDLGPVRFEVIHGNVG